MPFSGMSLNPARSFAGAFAANKWEHLWIYFVAPTFAMLAAGEVYVSWKKNKIDETGSAFPPAGSNFIQHDYKEMPHYPIEKKVTR
jgi:aquaporin Z